MKIFSGRKRAPHLGKYPMEKIKRVPKTTTYISDDVPRVPKRANFFNRAMLGDLGAKAKRERPRFVNKIPFARAMGKICRHARSLRRCKRPHGKPQGRRGWHVFGQLPHCSRYHGS